MQIEWPSAGGPSAVEALGSRGLRSGPLAADRARGVLSTALAAAGSWLLEPAEPAGELLSLTPPRPRPVIAVFGLLRGCGVTVVSRALAAELASRDARWSAAVHCEARVAAIPLATQPAARLARALAEVPGADTRAVGRLCLVGGADHRALADTARHLAPLVLDAGSSAVGGVPAALADRVVLVATPASEPSLASVAAACLGRLGHEPLVVLNRAPAEASVDEEPVGRVAAGGKAGRDWSLRPVHRLPESRMGAQLALGGREPRGELGRAVARLADLVDSREGPR
ncbi:MAG: MinD/ParA family ATP-binding protein [Thermoleophilaceae bacterium]